MPKKLVLSVLANAMQMENILYVLDAEKKIPFLEIVMT